jgi:mannosidase alpha-like ER degradation enhancer 1
LAHRAYLALWNRRSTHNLLGNTIGATHGQWLAPGFSGVGAGMDSFFEYGIKGAILLSELSLRYCKSLLTSQRTDDDTYLDIFQDSYSAIQTFVRTDDGFIVSRSPHVWSPLNYKQYRPVQFRVLHPATPSTIDSLAAFLPGMQVLAGDLESAIKAHLVYWNLWRRYSAIPESWDWVDRRIEWAGWPGRPEFIESTFYLYQVSPTLSMIRMDC